MIIEKYFKKRFDKQLQNNDVLLFDTWGLMAIFERYNGGKRKIRNTLLEENEPIYNSYEFLSEQRIKCNLTFCYTQITMDELSAMAIEGLPAKVQYLRRTAASQAINEICRFKLTTDLSQFSLHEQRNRFAILELALAWLEDIGEKNDSAIVREVGQYKINWIVSGDPHFQKTEVKRPLRSLGVDVINPKELDGVIDSELEALGIAN